MHNETKLINCFSTALGLDSKQINDELTYNSVLNWSSVAHMALIAELENQFDVMLDTDDIIALNSLKKARDILSNNGVTFT